MTFSKPIIILSTFGVILLLIAFTPVNTNKKTAGNSKNSFTSTAKETNTSNSASTLNTETIEYQLALINKNGYVSQDDITIIRFKSLLDMMTSIFHEENRQGIADGIVKTKELLKKDGISESLLNIAEGLNKVSNRNVRKITFNEMASLYVTFRVQGQTHEEALISLQ